MNTQELEIINKTNDEMSSVSDMRVIEVDESYDEKWEVFLHSNSSATFFHHPLWLKNLESESNQKLTRLVCIDSSNNIIGILPLLTTSGLPLNIGGIITSKRLSSLPRSALGGPLGVNEKVVQKLLLDALDRVKKLTNYTLQIKSERDTLNEGINDLVCVPWRQTYIKEMAPGNEPIELQNKKVLLEILRTNRRAEEAGASVRIADSIKDLREWYRLYLNTMRYYTVQARSWGFFEALWNDLMPQGLMMISLVELNTGTGKKLLNGIVNFKFKDTVYAAFKGNDRKYFKIKSNDLLHYHDIYLAQNEGYRYYDFGEVPKNHAGLDHFKKKWKMEHKQIYHYYSTESKELNFNLDPGNEQSLLRKIWRKIPLRITQGIGAMVNRRL